jgi:hypothetical protein
VWCCCGRGGGEASGRPRRDIRRTGVKRWGWVMRVAWAVDLKRAIRMRARERRWHGWHMNWSGRGGAAAGVVRPSGASATKKNNK